MWSSRSLLPFALACGAAPSPERAYISASLSGDPARCAEVSEPQLRGECVSLLARELALSGELARATASCAAEGLGRWQGECWFMVADGSEAIAERAQALCDRAGPQREQCLSHAAAREARALLAEPGGELAALRTLERRVAVYRGGPRVSPEARRLVIDQLADRDPGGPFSQAHCGALPAELCAEVLIARARRTRGVALCDADSQLLVAEDAATILDLARASSCAP